jgi:hypothetical protein
VCARDKCVEVWTGSRFDHLDFRFGRDGNFNLGCNDFYFRDCSFTWNAEHGVHTGSNGAVAPGYFQRCEIAWNGRHGVYHHYSSAVGYLHLDTCLIHDNREDGFHEDIRTNVEYAGEWVRNSALWNNGGWGVYATNAAGADGVLYLSLVNCLILANGTGSVYERDHANMYVTSASCCFGPVHTFGGKFAPDASDITADPLLAGATVLTSATEIAAWRPDPVLRDDGQLVERELRQLAHRNLRGQHHERCHAHPAEV